MIDAKYDAVMQKCREWFEGQRDVPETDLKYCPCGRRMHWLTSSWHFSAWCGRNGWWVDTRSPEKPFDKTTTDSVDFP